jgi:hypothetical protein
MTDSELLQKIIDLETEVSHLIKDLDFYPDGFVDAKLHWDHVIFEAQEKAQQTEQQIERSKKEFANIIAREPVLEQLWRDISGQ